ncbi:MAG: ABC transporter substrate-binding protein [Chloroflexi bacterium]|nr:ABC transporter substrate-binding protein [Chloroflexota bacterium]
MIARRGKVNCKCKIGVAFLLILVILAPVSLSCGGGGGGRVTITIGELTDFTGPAGPACKPIHYVIEDIPRYYNEENLIPGVKVKIAAYDTKTDPARELIGYEWCKGRGAKVVISYMPGAAEVLKPFAERDKVVIAALGALPSVFEPPGWVFGFSNTQFWAMKSLLQWVSDSLWDYDTQRIPKIGLAGWSDPSSHNLDKAIKEYVEKHPGKFDYMGGYFSAVGTTIFKGTTEKLKDCDYITSGSGMAMPYILRELRAIDSKARLIDATGSVGSFKGFYVDLVGWEIIDGTLFTNQSIYWNESTPIVDLAKTLLHQYRPSEAEEIIKAGVGYVGAAHQTTAILEVLQQAIQKVGTENFDGQAYFDAAIGYKTTSAMWEGYPEWGFSQTKRYLMDHNVIYEFSAREQDLLRITDWLPMVKE